MKNSSRQLSELHHHADQLLAGFQAQHQIADDAYFGMIRHADPIFYPTGSIRAREGDRLSHYLLLLEGVVRFQKRAANGRQITVFRVNGGESCALAAACLLSNQPLPAEVVSESDLYGFVIPRQRFIEGLSNSPSFREFVYTGYGEELNSVLSLATEIAFDPISVRVVRYLLANTDNRGIVKRCHQEIAEDLGTVREVVSREIRSLKANGRIAVVRGNINIKRRGELNEFLMNAGAQV